MMSGLRFGGMDGQRKAAELEEKEFSRAVTTSQLKRFSLRMNQTNLGSQGFVF
jgi:hypothetical protein